MRRVLFSIIFIISASAVGSAQGFTYYFPQIADGPTWQTTIFVSNAMASGSGAATITLTKSDGTPFMANWIDEMGNNVTSGGNVIAVTLAADTLHGRKPPKRWRKISFKYFSAAIFRDVIR